MIKKILIAIAFPLTMKAQSDTLVITDSMPVVSWRQIMVALDVYKDKATARQFELLQEFATQLFRYSYTQLQQKQKIESK